MPKKQSQSEPKEFSLFWADQIAHEIMNRKHFRYSKRIVPEKRRFTVKTSASMSGVLHIGRLSDTIRGDSVRIALRDAGKKADLIWVAEDMDPFRKVPKNVPASFKKYIGLPVTDVPDPEGSSDSYASHFKQEYLSVMDEYVSSPMKKYSMMDEYKKGSFNEQIRTLMRSFDRVKEILEKFHDNVPATWSPWVPICESCGKIATTQVLDASSEGVSYVCKDYKFDSAIAKGCNHKGFAAPGKAFGKLRWKSEWAAQWNLWDVSSEGAGKEYIVPNSAFWINAEISESILDYPSPIPIFYEHLMIDNKKMSASIGNVVYPKDWAEVASTDLLRFFYNKRLMKTRSFSWSDIPTMYDDFDNTRNLAKKSKSGLDHISRLARYSVLSDKKVPPLTFSHASVVVQISQDTKRIKKSLKKTGHWSDSAEHEIMDRIHKARRWLDLYAPEESKFSVQDKVPKDLNLSDSQKQALALLAVVLEEKDLNEKELFQEFYEIIRNKLKIGVKDFFSAAYGVLLNRSRGPKLAPFILAIGRKKCAKLFSEAAAS